MSTAHLVSSLHVPLLSVICIILMFGYSECKEMTEVMAVTVCGDRVFPLATITCHGSMRHHIHAYELGQAGGHNYTLLRYLELRHLTEEGAYRK